MTLADVPFHDFNTNNNIKNIVINRGDSVKESTTVTLQRTLGRREVYLPG